MCPPGCHHNGFMATPELGHRMYGIYIYSKNNRGPDIVSWGIPHLSWGATF